MVRPETKPDDVHGMLAARGILTSRGGRTSHAALVARQFGKPAVVGVAAIDVDPEKRAVQRRRPRLPRRRRRLDRRHDRRGVRRRSSTTVVPDFKDPYLLRAAGLGRRLPHARRLGQRRLSARRRSARAATAREGIGLCRTEHMFFETERLPLVQQMILAQDDAERDEALARAAAVPARGLRRALPRDGRPAGHDPADRPAAARVPAEPRRAAARRDASWRRARSSPSRSWRRAPIRWGSPARSRRRSGCSRRSRRMREANPMLGLRGVRLGIHLPALVRMQVRAIIEAACLCAREGIKVKPEDHDPAHRAQQRAQGRAARSSRTRRAR